MCTLCYVHWFKSEAEYGRAPEIRQCGTFQTTLRFFGSFRAYLDLEMWVTRIVLDTPAIVTISMFRCVSRQLRGPIGTKQRCLLLKRLVRATIVMHSGSFL